MSAADLVQLREGVLTAHDILGAVPSGNRRRLVTFFNELRRCGIKFGFVTRCYRDVVQSLLVPMGVPAERINMTFLQENEKGTNDAWSTKVEGLNEVIARKRRNYTDVDFLYVDRDIMPLYIAKSEGTPVVRCTRLLGDAEAAGDMRTILDFMAGFYPAPDPKRTLDAARAGDASDEDAAIPVPAKAPRL